MKRSLSLKFTLRSTHVNSFKYVLVRSESKCFTHLKKVAKTKDIYHNPKIKNNAFNLSDLGVL